MFDVIRKKSFVWHTKHKQLRNLIFFFFYCPLFFPNFFFCVPKIVDWFLQRIEMENAVLLRNLSCVKINNFHNTTKSTLKNLFHWVKRRKILIGLIHLSIKLVRKMQKMLEEGTKTKLHENTLYSSNFNILSHNPITVGSCRNKIDYHFHNS